MSIRYITFGFLDVIFSVAAFFVRNDHFSEGISVLATKKKYSYLVPSKRDNCVLSFSGFNTREMTNLLSLSYVFSFVTSSVVSLPSSPNTNKMDGSIACEANVGYSFPLIKYLQPSNSMVSIMSPSKLPLSIRNRISKLSFFINGYDFFDHFRRAVCCIGIATSLKASNVAFEFIIESKLDVLTRVAQFFGKYPLAVPSGWPSTSITLLSISMVMDLSLLFQSCFLKTLKLISHDICVVL